VANHTAFHDFIGAHLARLSRTAYLLTGNHHAAEDLLRSALATVAAKWQRVSRADDPESYVRRILYHEHVSIWRRSRHLRREVTVYHVPEPPGIGDPDRAERRLMLANALRRLTSAQRAVPPNCMNWPATRGSRWHERPEAPPGRAGRRGTGVPRHR
jgi:DNA-directed RNA polymerase specialized sigma24 family protein